MVAESLMVAACSELMLQKGHSNGILAAVDQCTQVRVMSKRRRIFERCALIYGGRGSDYSGPWLVVFQPIIGAPKVTP